MPLLNLLSRKVTIIRRSASEIYDEYGNEGVPDEAMQETMGELQQPARIVARSEYDQVVGVTTWTLFLFPDIEIDLSDVVEIDGQRYEVIGPPDNLYSIITGAPDHIEITLRHTGGAPS